MQCESKCLEQGEVELCDFPLIRYCRLHSLAILALHLWGPPRMMTVTMLVVIGTPWVMLLLLLLLLWCWHNIVKIMLEHHLYDSAEENRSTDGTNKRTNTNE